MPIPADDPVTVPATPAVTYDQWGVIAFAYAVDPYSGRTEGQVELRRCNDEVWSTRPADVAVMREPDLLAVAAEDPAVAEGVAAVISGVNAIAAALRARRRAAAAG